MDWREFERRLQLVATTEIGPRLMTAYSVELLTYLGADACFVIQELDAWTATLLFTGHMPGSAPGPDALLPFGPAQLHELTQDGPYVLVDRFTPRRPLKPLLGAYQQLALLRLDTYMFKGWIVVGRHQPADLTDREVELAMFRFADKVVINHLSLQKIALEQQYRFLFATVPQAIVRINEDDRTSWVNQAAIELLDLEPDTLNPSAADISVSMTRLLQKAKNRDAINEQANSMLQDPNFVMRDWLWVFEHKALSVQTIPIRSPYFRGRIWLFNDVSELYRKNEQLLDANREIENLISVIAHDLKSPLATLNFVLNFMPMIGELNDEQQENIDYGLKTIKRGVNLIDSIVFYNRLISSNEPVQLVDVELDDLLELVVEGFEVQAYQKTIALHVGKPAQPVVLHTDPESLVRILDNLISNALKFSPFGKNVYVSAYLQDAALYISVQDEGPGIRPEDQPKLFKRFQRLAAQPTNNENSSGLGLSIVKSLADKLGALIEVDSVMEQGTTFRLVFPASFVKTPNREDTVDKSH